MWCWSVLVSSCCRACTKIYLTATYGLRPLMIEMHVEFCVSIIRALKPYRAVRYNFAV